ncbi:MAG: hypothetical protein KF725_10025 [Cyclobacteriaceae bacterium]|nr:hypothetical protein [Cyclobacteriaceae bacterium]UYN86049.1 MAG: hypothetical protein KIT51_14420 [Cyclobacteriaceae bacterium]
MDTTARIISIIFHPLLMPTYLFALLAAVSPALLYPFVQSIDAFLTLLFLMTFLLPAVNVGLFRLLGVVKDVSMVNRKERIRPFAMIALLYAVFTYLLSSKFKISLGDNVFNLIIIIDGLVIFSLLITFFYKASIHSVGVWGVIGILLPLNKVIDDNAIFSATLVALVVAGVVMSARLQLNAHTPREVLVGSVVGFSIGFFGMIILF